MRSVIYTRISEDPKLTGLGVERQLEDCRAFCQANGWTIVAEYSDNDISAYSGKKRPGYQALCDDIKNRKVDVVVAWHTDRIHRRLRELVEYTDLVRDDRGHMVVATHTIKAGDIDLSTPNGIMIAHIKGAVDEAYVSESREKNLRGRLQIAQKGGRHKCKRVYGWEDDGIHVRESEAVIVREIVQRIIDGQSPTNIAATLNARNIPTVNGAKWQGLNVRKCAARASNAALREHLGVIYPGNWEAIISRETWEQGMLALKNRANMKYKRGTGRKYLLTGFAFCGNCGIKLSATVGSGKQKASYRCHTYRSSGYGPEGCGLVSRNIAALEDLVSEAILYRLDSPQLLESMNQHQDDSEAITGLLRQRQAQQAQLDELVNDYYSQNILTRAQFLSAKAGAEANLESLTRQLNSLTSRKTIGNIDLTSSLRETWDKATIEWKRNLVEMLIERVDVDAYKPHAKVVYFKQWRFDPALVRITWLS